MSRMPHSTATARRGSRPPSRSIVRPAAGWRSPPTSRSPSTELSSLRSTISPCRPTRRLPPYGDWAVMAAFLGLFRRDLRLSLRQGGEIGLVLGFFVLAVLLFPFGVGPEPQLLGRIAGGIGWAAALLASAVGLRPPFRF